MTATVLVTDGRSLSSLAIVRSLGQLGCDVHVCDDFKRNLSAFSKYVSDVKVHEPVGADPTAFIDWLVACCERRQYDLIVPVRDETTLAVSTHRERVSGVTEVFIADPSAIKQLMDKGRCMKTAEQLGIPIPTTYYPDEDLESVRANSTFPVLIKPRAASGARGIVRVDDPTNLARKYEAVNRAYQNPIIQEFVDHSGGHYSIGTLFDETAEPVATHVYKETRQYPSSGGPAIAAHTVEREPWIESMLDLLRTHDWKGPAHMDVLYDPDSEEYKLLEVNPRFWSSLGLTINSGVDIPRQFYQLAVEDGTPEHDNQYLVETNYRWILPNELLWVWEQENKLRAAQQLGMIDSNTCCATLSRDDLRPVLGVVAQAIGYLQDSNRRKKIFDRGWSIDHR
ncbi:carboxylate--amine ligase [Halohasta litchfieldiae]|jgi:predicted ATP-grasp superfamily ATP-dependent carboligase|uniref:Predicted ATP-dependent carboligase, ATP-grasp superfamily n=1 Tax=Halohasta litchfieldiae TaxID=1073996 RepID=A0A1H6Y8U7_9EURY|nr:ATP-grasp domain-containing protein [Halohasta litchfieldiae]SEJ37651.1 Predicted ATP-dependent carboligase, ATP-grasp superfamily [Halohasta litchfieldiae]